MRRIHYEACAAFVVMSVCGCGDDDAPVTSSTGGSSAGMGGAGGAGVSGSGGERPSFGGSGGLGDYIPGSGGSAGSSDGGASAGSGSVDAGSDPFSGSDAGTVQSCLSERACSEFRGHSVNCQASNAPNCVNILGGVYIEAPCPADFVFAEVEETFCGPTAGFLSPQACCDSPRFGPGLCPSCPPE